MKDSKFEISSRLDDLLNTTLGSDRVDLELRGYELYYIVSNIEHVIRLEKMYNLDIIENKDMKELHDECLYDIKDTLLHAKERYKEHD